MQILLEPLANGHTQLDPAIEDSVIDGINLFRHPELDISRIQHVPADQNRKDETTKTTVGKGPKRRMKRHCDGKNPKEIMGVFPHLEFKSFFEDRHWENDYKCAEDHNHTCDTRRIATHWIGP